MGVRKSAHLTKMQAIYATPVNTAKYNKHNAHTLPKKGTDLKFDITHNEFWLATTTISPNRPLCLWSLCVHRRLLCLCFQHQGGEHRFRIESAWHVGQIYQKMMATVVKE